MARPPTRADTAHGPSADPARYRARPRRRPGSGYLAHIRAPSVAATARRIPGIVASGLRSDVGWI